MLSKIFFIAFFVSISCCSFSQENYARQVVATLCSDSLFGRGYVNNGVNKAAKFLQKEFKKAGLKPLFNDTSYVQNYSFKVNTFPGEMRVKQNQSLLRAGIDYIVNPSSGSFHGILHLLTIDSIDISDKEHFNMTISRLSSSKKNGLYLDLTHLTSPHELAKRIRYLRPLAMICPLVITTNQKFTWSVGHKQLRFPLLLVKTKKLISNEPINVAIDARLIPNFESKNIGGFFPSTNKNADTIVFTAHFDHLGMMGSYPNGGAIFPGGNDNASGTAMLISMARYFQKHPNKYTIVFIAFSGEEAGLLGSKYFTKTPPFPLSSIHFLVNLDIMGSGEDGITVVNGRIFNKEFKLLEKINHRKHYLSQIKKRGETANSDHFFFYNAGVPCFFIYTMGPNKNYHDVYDTYENLSFSAYDNIVKLLVDFIEKL